MDEDIVSKLGKGAKDFSTDEHVQVMLLCGSDVLESFTVPGLWNEEHVGSVRVCFFL